MNIVSRRRMFRVVQYDGVGRSGVVMFGGEYGALVETRGDTLESGRHASHANAILASGATKLFEFDAHIYQRTQSDCDRCCENEPVHVESPHSI